MANKRQAKEITDQKILDDLLNVQSEDIGTTYIMEMFGEFKGKSRVNTYDIITVPKGKYGKEGYSNLSPIRTTAGLWIFNKYFIEPHFLEYIGYFNETISDDSFGDLNTRLSYALLEDEIELKEFKQFLNKTQKFMPYVSALSTHMTEKMLLSSEENNRKKNELLKKYKTEIEAGNGAVAEQIEKELINHAKEYLKDDPSSDSFASGARGSWGNNYKNLWIMKGAIKNVEKEGYDIVTDNYVDGISKENYHTIANSLTEGPYARGKKTAIGGYWEKQFINAFQHIVLDKDNSNCGTDKYIEFVLDKPADWMYSYIIEGNMLVELTSKNVSKYKGKKVKMRFSGLCKSKTGICHKCAGNLFNRLGGIKHVGIMSAEVPAKLKLLSMKSFHNSLVKYTEMNIMHAFDME